MKLDKLPANYREQAIKQMGATTKKQSKYRNKKCYLCQNCGGIFAISEVLHNHWDGIHSCPRTGCPYIFIKDDKFDSILEATAYVRLCAQYGKENIIRQVSIPLGGGASIRPDFFAIILTSGMSDWPQFKLFDAKGHETRDWKNKRKWLKDKYRVGIELIKE